MLYRSIAGNTALFYSRELELLLAAQSVMQDSPVQTLCTEVFGTKAIEELRQKYHFLREVCQALCKLCPMGIFEHLVCYPLDRFTLVNYRDCLLALPPEDFLSEYLFLPSRSGSAPELVRRALDDDEALDELYQLVQDSCGGYLGFQTFIRQSSRFINEYFALAAELDCEAFRTAVDDAMPRLETELDAAGNALEQMPPLEYTEQRMSTVFKNRGPFTAFRFMPTLFMCFRACRIFQVGDMPDKHHIFFASIWRRPADIEDMVRKLKIIADNTRCKIVAQLSKGEVLRGMDIAKRLSLSPSTVSHHMDLLTSGGIVNEEQVKNSKYYSINRLNMDELLRTLSDTLGKPDPAGQEAAEAAHRND